MSAEASTEDPAQHSIAEVEVEHGDRCFRLPFHERELVDQLRDEAVGRFELKPAPSEFILLNSSDAVLAGHLTLTDAGVEPGALLRLVLKKVEITSNGRTEPFAFRADELVGKLRQSAVERFGIVQNPHLYALYKKHTGEEGLNDNLTLEQAGIHPGELLILRQSRVRGGSR
jgi:hypothetical protein